MKIKVYWDSRRMESEGEFFEDESGHEFQGPQVWSRYIRVSEHEIESDEDLDKVMDMEDGDYDFQETILFITDESGRILLDKRFKPSTVEDSGLIYDYRKAESEDERKDIADKIVQKCLATNYVRRKDYARRIEDFKARTKCELQAGDKE